MKKIHSGTLVRDVIEHLLAFEEEEIAFRTPRERTVPTSCSYILKETLLHTRKFCSLEASSRQIQSDLPYRAAADTILLWV